MPSRFYRRRWDETRGDEFDHWGHSLWYIEVDGDGCPVRQMEVYDTGPVHRYDAGHDHDRYGALGDTSLHDPGEDWSRYEITAAEFELAWAG